MDSELFQILFTDQGIQNMSCLCFSREETELLQIMNQYCIPKEKSFYNKDSGHKAFVGGTEQLFSDRPGFIASRMPKEYVRKIGHSRVCSMIDLLQKRCHDRFIFSYVIQESARCSDAFDVCQLPAEDIEKLAINEECTWLNPVPLSEVVQATDLILDGKRHVYRRRPEPTGSYSVKELHIDGDPEMRDFKAGVIRSCCGDIPYNWQAPVCLVTYDIGFTNPWKQRIYYFEIVNDKNILCHSEHVEVFQQYMELARLGYQPASPFQPWIEFEYGMDHGFEICTAHVTERGMKLYEYYQKVCDGMPRKFRIYRREPSINDIFL